MRRVGPASLSHAPHHGRDLLPAHQGPAPLRAGQPDAGPRPPQRRGGGRRHGLRALDALRAVGPVPRRRPAPPRAPVRPGRGRDAGGGRAGPLPGLHRVDDAPATTVWQASPTAARVSGGLDYSRVVYLHPGGHDLLNASDAADGPGSAVNGTRIVVDGQTYAVEDVDAFGCGAD